MARLGLDYKRANAINLFLGAMGVALSTLLTLLVNLVREGKPIDSSWIALLVIIIVSHFGAWAIRWFIYESDSTNGQLRAITQSIQGLEKRIEDSL